MDRTIYEKIRNDIDRDAWSLVKSFNPDNNLVDQKLLFMITGRGCDKQGGVDEEKFIWGNSETQDRSQSMSSKVV